MRKGASTLTLVRRDLHNSVSQGFALHAFRNSSKTGRTCSTDVAMIAVFNQITTELRSTGEHNEWSYPIADNGRPRNRAERDLITWYAESVAEKRGRSSVGFGKKHSKKKSKQFWFPTNSLCACGGMTTAGAAAQSSYFWS